MKIDYLANQKRFAPTLTRHMYAHWRSLLDSMGKSRQDFAQSMRDRYHRDSLPLALVAYEKHQVLGTIALKPQDLDIRPELTPWLGGLFVLPQYRRRGIGSALISGIVAEAERLRLPCLFLWTPSSERLYARHGWSLLERAPYHGHEISIMKRALRHQIHGAAQAGPSLSPPLDPSSPLVTSMRLIRYCPEHCEAMLALHRSALTGFKLGMSQQEDEADLMAIEQVYFSRGGDFLIGFLDGRLVAMGGFQRLGETVAELRRMRIERELQGKGYGTQLLQELESRAYDLGIRTLCLETARRRPLTLGFYRKHGYQETGRGFYGAVETVRFSKALGARPTTRPCHVARTAR